MKSWKNLISALERSLRICLKSQLLYVICDLAETGYTNMLYNIKLKNVSTFPSSLMIKWTDERLLLLRHDGWTLFGSIISFSQVDYTKICSQQSIGQ